MPDTHPSHRRGLLAGLLVAAILAVSISYSPLVQVAKPAQAAYPIQQSVSSQHGGVEWRWHSNIPCIYGAVGRSVGGSQISISAWYSDCKPANYKGVCVRLYRDVWELLGDQLVLTARWLVRVSCRPSSTGSSGAALSPILFFPCISGLYSIEALFLTSNSASVHSSPFQCIL